MTEDSWHTLIADDSVLMMMAMIVLLVMTHSVSLFTFPFRPLTTVSGGVLHAGDMQDDVSSVRIRESGPRECRLVYGQGLTAEY